VPCFPGDVKTPALIRQSIRDADGAFRAKRAGSPDTGIPSFWKLLRNKASIISNWAIAEPLMIVNFSYTSGWVMCERNTIINLRRKL